jgi:hypothetical protein
MKIDLARMFHDEPLVVGLGKIMYTIMTLSYSDIACNNNTNTSAIYITQDENIADISSSVPPH